MNKKRLKRTLFICLISLNAFFTIFPVSATLRGFFPEKNGAIYEFVSHGNRYEITAFTYYFWYSAAIFSGISILVFWYTRLKIYFASDSYLKGEPYIPFMSKEWIKRSDDWIRNIEPRYIWLKYLAGFQFSLILIIPLIRAIF